MSVGSVCATIEGLQMIQGEVPSLPAKGFVTCIECWATWCGPCRQVFPHLSQVANRFKEDLKVVGVTQEPLTSQLRQFVASQGANMSYPVAVDGYQDVQEKLMMPANARGIPHAFLIDHAGVIQYSGHPADPNFEAVVSDLCRKAQAARVPELDLTQEGLSKASVKDIKRVMQAKGVSYKGMTEKQELIDALLAS
eukprot:TRINITY_DN11472_c0_g3_i1.p1 TRINITY_DN11472_c0_g3~~TRINITY_DN11472_c0_g3_i1.p1  ORF type:complete len:195 (+),score=45.61 TRINITY_DN11472_c0_g3_i1:129-713(+)